MINPIKSQDFLVLNFTFTQQRTYLFAFIFIIGNLFLPQLTHTIPKGGLIFLPIYFFTLIGSYKFGIRVGLFTAILSPLINNLLFGMPPASVLPIILIKSGLLAIFASFYASRFKSISILNLFLVVISYQFVGSIFEWLITKNIYVAMQDIKLGLPGLIIQILFGYILLKKLSGFGK